MEVAVVPRIDERRGSGVDDVALDAGALDDLFTVVRNLSACFITLISAPRPDYDTAATVLGATRTLIDKAEGATRDHPATPTTRELGRVLQSLRKSHRDLSNLLPSTAGQRRHTPNTLMVGQLLQRAYAVLHSIVAQTSYAAIFYADGCVCHRDVENGDSPPTSLWRS